MAKIKSFADKMSKDKSAFLKHCPKCGESITTVKLVASELSDKTGAYRFKQSFVGVCKCNENNVMKPIVRGQSLKAKTLQPDNAELAVKGQSKEVKAPKSDNVE